MKRAFLLIPLAAIAVAFLWWSQQPRGPVTVSGVIEAHDIRVGSRVGGRVREVRVREGDGVKAGNLLVSLDPYDLSERLAETEALLAAQRATLTKLKAGYRAEEKAQSRAIRDRYRALLDKAKAGPRPLEKQIAQDRVDLADADLRKTQTDFQKVKTLFDRGEATADEMSEVTRARGHAGRRNPRSRGAARAGRGSTHASGNRFPRRGNR
jgi:multidrug resistance efflux pump